MGIKYMKHVKFFVFLCILTFTVSCGQQKKYVNYKVKEGETMKIIAKSLDMKTKDLLRLNPDVGRKPEANTIIVIPNKKIATDNTKKDDVVIDETKKVDPTIVDEVITDKESILEELKNNFVVYEVKKGDTFYSLTRFYNVTQEEMIVLNPELSEGLKVGQIIRIKEIEEGEEKTEVHIYEDVIDAEVSLKVALLLPFKTNENDTIKSKDLFINSRLANIVTDFYLGTEIAIDSLRKQGIQIDLNVFDTEKKGTKIKSILEENNLNDNDVIIGPLYSEEAEVIASSVNTPVVFPHYSKKQSKFSSSKLIKTSPEKSVFREELTTFIKESYTEGNLILVGDGKTTSNISNNVMKASLESHDSINVVNVLKPKDGYIAKDRFLEILKPNENNWVVLTSNDDVLVADAINSLISLPDSTNVTVFTYNKGRAFNKIANLKLAKVNLTYVSDEYVDESSASTELFNKQYFRKNNALPSYYATKGFDITYDILIRLASGKDLKSTFKEGASYRIESKFDYNNKLFGTSENKGLFIVKYNQDLSLTRLK
ncbi:LysM peptidoglycan-binding domain-containing protein [uncultured Polaribacter sp.]|uniref:LysM peptidoglycan-binding domain-containing protein n=1 Tax=uncultured Polaribacter sp. TaxID=174711 RepID=UPI002638671F|nr:LysM peptidoglycan-binding domain-containing protein [uncultured Polaribacter sp.]